MSYSKQAHTLFKPSGLECVKLLSCLTVSLVPLKHTLTHQRFRRVRAFGMQSLIKE